MSTTKIFFCGGKGARAAKFLRGVEAGRKYVLTNFLERQFLFLVCMFGTFNSFSNLEILIKMRGRMPGRSLCSYVYAQTDKTERVGVAVTLLIRVREVVGSNSGRDIGYPD
jgi:hypothetical protein